MNLVAALVQLGTEVQKGALCADYEGPIGRILRALAGESLPPEKAISVGDFVRVTTPTHFLVGKSGKVIRVLEGWSRMSSGKYVEIAVEFPDLLTGHDCQGCAAKGHGWNFILDDVTKIA